ncbi:hypothetical protein ACVIJW_000641 [Bradyrhizobium barranii subsp. barranii]
MSVSCLDVFLAFLGMTFGLPSVLPGLFFQPKGRGASNLASDVDRRRPNSNR